MTLRIHAPNPIRVGETKNVLVTSDNPGVVSLTYGAGLTGPATCEITGTRVWRNGLKHGQYLARATSAAAGRKDVSWCLEVDYAQMTPTHGGTTLDTNLLGIFSSVAYDKQRMLNWHFSLQCFKGADATATYRLLYNQSNAASPGEASFLLMSIAHATPPVYRFVVTAPDPATDNKLYCYYTTGISPDVTGAGRVVTNDTMGGNQAIMIAGPLKGAKFARMLSQAERQAFVTSGTLPATPEISYQGGHEIDPAAPVFWDTSGNNLDLTTALNIPTFPPAAASGDYTDTSPVTPYAIVPVTAIATTGTTIDATRPRQGVPARASEAEKTETADQVTVTVEAALPPDFAIGPDLSTTAARFPTSRRFTIYSQTDGAVTLASDNAKVLVPASVVVVDGFAVFDASISGAVSGVTITATQGASTATCSVAVALASPVVPTMATNDTLQLFPEWLWTEPHTQGISAVMDDRRASFVSDLDHLLIYDFENQTSSMLDLVAEMFAIYGWNKAAGTTEKVAFLESSLKILRKSGTHYAVNEAIRLVCDAAKIESITIIPGAGNLFNGYYDFDGSINYDSLYHWAKFDVEIYTSDIPYFSDEIKTVITSMINHYKPASRWFENLLIKGIA